MILVGALVRTVALLTIHRVAGTTISILGNVASVKTSTAATTAVAVTVPTRRRQMVPEIRYKRGVVVIGVAVHWTPKRWIGSTP